MSNSVRSRRKECGLTQEELARQCNVSRQTIIAMEKGVHEPSLNLALRISFALASTVDGLFKLDGAPTNQ
ncbi:MAG: helix-turn-helix transcriptional regulator [Specibacter sp.]